MSTIALGFLVVLTVAMFTFYIAAGVYGHGSAWARDVCSLGRDLCDHPAWTVVATAVMAGVYLVLRSFRL